MLLLTRALEPVCLEDIEGEETPSKRRLIAAGERLLGERGFNGVSLQEIARGAGQSNKYAVQYHFGSKDGLIRAIFGLRLRSINRRRQALLDRIASFGLHGRVGALLEALVVPFAEQVDGEGRHSYARFWLQYLARPDYDRFHDSLFDPTGGPTAAVFELLSLALHTSPDETTERFFPQAASVLLALIDRDNRIAHGREVPAAELVVRRTVAMMASALTQGIPPAPAAGS